MSEVDKTCPLCDPDKKTHWYHSDEICWVAVCDGCGGDMIVYKYHNEPSEKEIDYMWKITQELFPGKNWRGYRKTIFDHWHEHIV